MLIIISPAKRLDFSNNSSVSKFEKPLFLKQSQKLVDIMRKKTVKEIAELMSLSDKLAQLNKERYQNFKTPFNLQNAKQAIFAFKGDVYQGMNVDTFEKKDIEYAQRHLRILSGLYGVLSPLDLIMPYRLEMGTRLKIGNDPDLYHYWRESVTQEMNSRLSSGKHNALINLASREYSRVVDFSRFKKPVVTPVFKEKQKGTYKIIGIFAKKARGMMSRHILLNRIKTVDDIKSFKEEGYRFNKKMSSESEMVFCRG
ncbi:MAG: peroxide stress protein YaaA [Halobacteriovoraceae bacterium]|nr:peroxide stress protein YaaA [Halobacteriovoraceae bacterium]